MIDTLRQQAVGMIATGEGPVRAALTPDGHQLVFAAMHENKVQFADRRP